MRKIYFASLISFTLLLGACGSIKPAENIPEKTDSEAVTDVKQPGTNLTAEKRSNGTLNATEGKKPDGKDIASPGINAGITVNKIDFNIVNENIPAGLQSLIDSNKATKGYIVKEIDGSWYVAVLMGEQLTGGYGIEVKTIEDSEGRTIITVEEAKPAPDAIVLMSLTYPCQVVKITDGIAPNFTVANQDGEEYSEIR